MNGIGKSRSFLTEFIIVILFFSIAAVVVVNTYSKANEKSRDSQFLSGASLEAEKIEANLCEAEFDYDSPIDAKENSVNRQLEKMGFVDGKYIYYDEKFKAVDKENAKYIGEISVMVDESREYSKIISFDYKIYMRDNSSKVYSISFNKLLFKGGNVNE